MRRQCLIIITVYILGLSNCFCQNREFLPNRVLYTKYNLSDFFNDSTRWAWELDVVFRRQSELGKNDFWAHPLRFSVRPWIAYQVTKMVRVSFQPVGFFHSAPRFSTEADLDRDFEREFRSTIQVINYVYIGRCNFTHRIRAESRWRGLDLPDGPVHNYRMRYRLRLQIPLNTNYFYKNNTLYTSMYSETHIEFGKNYGTNYFSQSRNYVGLGYRFWNWTRVELGYIYQLNPRGNNKQIDVSIGPMFYLFMDVFSRNQRKYQYSF